MVLSPGQEALEHQLTHRDLDHTPDDGNRYEVMRDDDGYYGAPDLVVEVLSSKPQLDRYLKLNKYAAAGVPHHWIVDPDAHLLSAYRLAKERYELVCDLSGDASLSPELFPGLTIELAELWI